MWTFSSRVKRYRANRMLIQKCLMQKVIFSFLAIVNLTTIGVQAQNQLSFVGFDEKLHAYMTALHKVGEFSGNVLVAHRGEVKFHRSYGFASKRFGIPNQIKTRFRIASMSKSFTAICILQMVERGKLSLDDAISEYVELPHGSVIKIKHLLSHSSGLGRDITFPNERKTYGLAEVVDLIKSDSLLFQPGTKTFYSNRNYVLLQLIVEKVAGVNYETYLTRNILTPLGLSNTGIEHPLSPPEFLADGFGPGVDRNGNFEIHETQMISFGYPAGVTGLYSTTGDMFKFCSALGKSPILKPETWKLAFTPLLKESPFMNWGLGFTILGNEDLPVLNHNGKTTGFTGGYFHDLKEDFTVIILANNSEAARSSIVNTIQFILEGKEYYTPRIDSSIHIKEENLKACVGEYRTKDFIFKISEFEGRLYVESHGDAPTSLSASDSTSFFSDYFDLKLLFNSKNGVVDECKWIFQGKSSMAQKIK